MVGQLDDVAAVQRQHPDVAGVLERDGANRSGSKRARALIDANGGAGKQQRRRPKATPLRWTNQWDSGQTEVGV